MKTRISVIYWKKKMWLFKGKCSLENLLEFWVLDFNKKLDTDHQLGIIYLASTKVSKNSFTKSFVRTRLPYSREKKHTHTHTEAR